MARILGTGEILGIDEMLALARLMKYSQRVPPTYIGADYGKEDHSVTTLVAGNFEPQWRDMKTNLVLAETFQEAQDFAHLMGWRTRSEWSFVVTYRSIFNFRGSTCYIIAGGREREDFGAIEGLFIQANIKVIDMEQ